MSFEFNANTQSNHLQQAWSRFCEEKSLTNFTKSDDDVIALIVNDNKRRTLFPYPASFHFIRIFINNYCIDVFSKRIGTELLKSFDWKFFNASLLMSLSDDDFEIDNDLCEAEKEFDGYEEIENENHYDKALVNAAVIKLIIACYPYNLSVLKNLFDKLECPLDKALYERIWKRAIELDEEINCNYN